MLKRNFPVILLLLVFVALLDVIYTIPRNAFPTPEISIAPEPEENLQSFTGRVVMPGLDDMYVLENTSGRDIEQVEKFLQGRAAGLHYLATEHFKNLRKSKKSSKHGFKGGDHGSKSDDLLVGVRLSLDSLGQFELKEYVFSNTEDEDFKNRLDEHIKYYWRYTKCASGKLEFWVPIRWLAEYSKN